MSNTLTYLQDQYGPLMTMQALANTFDRSKEGLRVCLSSKTPFSVALNSAKKKCGRRVYFRTEAIAEIIDSDHFI